MTLQELKIQVALGTLKTRKQKVGDIKIAFSPHKLKIITIIGIEYAVPNTGQISQPWIDVNYAFTEGQILAMARAEYSRLTRIREEYDVDTVVLHLFKDPVTDKVIQAESLDYAA